MGLSAAPHLLRRSGAEDVVTGEEKQSWSIKGGWSDGV